MIANSDCPVSNYILLKIRINSVEMLIGSVYGPKKDDFTFFDQIEVDLTRLKSEYVILGGGLEFSLQ